jgi:hypothetical protein
LPVGAHGMAALGAPDPYSFGTSSTESDGRPAGVSYYGITVTAQPAIVPAPGGPTTPLGGRRGSRDAVTKVCDGCPRVLRWLALLSLACSEGVARLSSRSFRLILGVGVEGLRWLGLAIFGSCVVVVFVVLVRARGWGPRGAKLQNIFVLY